MKSVFNCGPARRARGMARRRALNFAPVLGEKLESRRLLAAGTIGINVEIGAYASLVNWLQIPETWGPNPSQSNTITYNSSGDPTSDATLLFDYRVDEPWNGPDPNAVAPNLVGTYSLSFNGQATISPEYPGFSTPFTVENQSYNPSTNTTTAGLVVPATNSSEFFGITFSNTQATSSSGTDTGFSNARLIRPGYAANSTQLYTNEFLAALQPYSVLRYLDPEGTNVQPFFNGNTLVTVNASQVDQTGMPWEYLVTLANETNTDMWINVPQGATDDYVAALAGIIKNGGTVGGVTYAGLNPNLKVYVEYSNEVWGGIPGNEYYQEAAVQNSATNQPLSTFPGNADVYDNPDGSTTTDDYTAMGRRYLERTAEIGQIFQSVIGADPNHDRIRPVLGWQEDAPGFFPEALSWYEHFFGPASAAFYGMGTASYWSPTDYSSVDAAIASLEAQETSYAIPNTIDNSAIATFYGLANVSYEGGPSISGDPGTPAGLVALAVSRDPRMEQIVYQHYIDFFEDGGELANYYDGPFGTLSPENQWPIAELSQYEDPSASPRYEGTVDVANASPVSVTAETPVAPNSSTTIVASTDTIGTNFTYPNDGEQGFWLLNAASPGTFDLSLSTSVGGAGTLGQFDVFLNDKQVGGVFTQSLTTSLDLGDLTLSAGLNTLSVVILNSGSQFRMTNFTLTPVETFAIGDPGFENESVGYGQYLYDPTGSGWTFSGLAGISGNDSNFTRGNTPAPQGVQVAILQQTGSFSQVVNNWSAGSYVLSFEAVQRMNFGTSAENFEVLIDGLVVGTFKPTNTGYETYSSSEFSVGAGTHTISFVGLDSVGGDNTAFLDSIALTTASTTPALGDPGFENDSVGSGQFLYDPTASSWIFKGLAGVSGNGSGFTSGNAPAPQGSQVAFLQDTGSFSQVVSNWSAGSYILSFSAAQRTNFGTSAEDFEILVDGMVVATFKPTTISYLTYTTPAFPVGEGPHNIAFVGLDSAGGDNTVFLDNLTLAVAPSVPAVGDVGFENEALGYSHFLYDPTGSSWSFSGLAGISNNGSGFTSGNSVAPQGSQVAFLQDQGSFSQAVADWSAGTYTIAFDAAQRANYGISAQDFEILIDGVLVGTYKPSSIYYSSYSTTAFTVGAGTHTITFVGLDSVGGDNTVFLDDISLS